MEVRGSILKGISDFVKVKHPSGYEKWVGSLSSTTRIMLGNLSVSSWYAIDAAMIQPSSQVCKMFFEDAGKGAWQMGRFAAEQGLTGVYKVFIMIASPSFILKRAPRIMTTFYTPSQLNVLESTNRSVRIRCSALPVKSELLEFRIAGWIERAAEICNCQDVKVEISSTLSGGDQTFDMYVTWR